MALTEQLLVLPQQIRSASSVGQSDDYQRRLNVYQSLFFNNIEGFVSTAFPVLKSLYSAESWNALVRTFFVQHQCRSPYFVEISKEFVEFLSSEYTPTASDPIFITELAHYEWLELDVSIRQPDPNDQTWDQGVLPKNVKTSHLASLVSYPYPVHAISCDFIPSEPTETYYYLVYQGANFEVEFQILNALSAHVFQTIELSEEITLDELTHNVVNALGNADEQQVRLGLQERVEQWLMAGVLNPA